MWQTFPPHALVTFSTLLLTFIAIPTIWNPLDYLFTYFVSLSFTPYRIWSRIWYMANVCWSNKGMNDLKNYKILIQEEKDQEKKTVGKWLWSSRQGRKRASCRAESEHISRCAPDSSKLEWTGLSDQPNMGCEKRKEQEWSQWRNKGNVGWGLVESWNDESIWICWIWGVRGTYKWKCWEGSWIDLSQARGQSWNLRSAM